MEYTCFKRNLGKFGGITNRDMVNFRNQWMNTNIFQAVIDLV